MSDVREEVAQQVVQEWETLKPALATAERLEAEVREELAAKSETYWKIARRVGYDKKPTDKEGAAAREMDAVQDRYNAVSRALASTRAKIKRLDDPAEFERRVAERTQTSRRIASLTTEGSNMAGTATRGRSRARNSNGGSGRVEVPVELRKRIAKLVKDGNGVSAVAAILNDEGVKRPASGKADWYARAVYNIATKELGVDDLSSVRNSKPLKSRAVKDQPPRQTTKLDKPKPSSSKRQSAPISKASQASGTSRGGSGSRKRAASKATKRVASGRKQNPRKR